MEKQITVKLQNIYENYEIQEMYNTIIDKENELDLLYKDLANAIFEKANEQFYFQGQRKIL